MAGSACCGSQVQLLAAVRPATHVSHSITSVLVFLGVIGHAEICDAGKQSRIHTSSIHPLPAKALPPVATSQSSMPKAYTSLALLQRPCIKCSGAMCVRVPWSNNRQSQRGQTCNHAVHLCFVLQCSDTFRSVTRHSHCIVRGQPAVMSSSV